MGKINYLKRDIKKIFKKAKKIYSSMHKYAYLKYLIEFSNLYSKNLIFILNHIK